MASAVVYDPNTNQVLEFHVNINPALFAGKPNTKIYDANTSPTEAEVKSIFTVPTIYVKVVGNAVQVMNDSEIATVNANYIQANNLKYRSDAITVLNNLTGDGKIQRAAALVTMDAINVLRDWVTQFQVQVAAATSLADLKTRVAALPNLGQITGNQLINAILNKINSGSAD